MWNLILLGGLALLVYYVLQRKENKDQNLPPGPFRLPLVGNLLQIVLTDRQFAHVALTKLSKPFGEIAYFQTGLTNSITINGYDAVKRALGTDDFLNRMDDKWLLDRTYGKPWGLINSNGDFWRQSRRFTVRHLRDFGFAKRNVMTTYIHREINAINALVKSKMDSNNRAEIDPKEVLMIPAVNVVWSSISGERFELTDELGQSLAHYLYVFTRSMQFAGGVANAFPFVLDWFPGLMGRNQLNEYIAVLQSYMKKLVADYRAKGTYKENPENFIEAYLQAIDAEVASGENAEANSIFSDEQLMTIVFDLFWAGIETTSTILCFTYLYLATHPEVQQKMRDEIKATIDGEIQVEDRNRLKYCHAVNLEAFRHASIVPLGPRKVFRKTDFNGYTIPANTTALMNYYSIHHDKNFWRDPENFRPERFLNASGNIVNAERVMAFSSGKRECPGYSIAESVLFLMSAKLVQDYEILKVPGKHYDMEPLPGLSVAPKPFTVILKKINA